MYRLAHRLQLAGWVRNDGGEVDIHAQGACDKLEEFGAALLRDAPPAASARVLAVRSAAIDSTSQFRILASQSRGAGGTHVPADLFTCDECLAELRSPTARRHRYPFINCTQCGPRYTVIRAMPFDRPNTTLQHFPLCDACESEYIDPHDRRFHAQPLACAVCGPGLYWHSGGCEITGNAAALSAAVQALRAGHIIALRGVGGYHLLCDAADQAAVARLRLRKGRPAKPLAILVPWRGADGLDCARGLAVLSPLEAAELRGAVRPIVLARRGSGAHLAASIAPGLRDIALMLPYSPLHELLTQEIGGALVATSGNLSGEPVLTEPDAAQTRLRDVADGYLHHNRPIARPADDPVVRVIAGSARPLRLGRGNAPLELDLPHAVDRPLLGVGAYLKTTVAMAWGNRAVVSPHIGELRSPRGREVFAQITADLQHLYGVRAECVVHDAHPDFPNSRWARDCGLPARAVWHHHAHAAAVAGEFPSVAPLLCFTWDGMGLGPDGTLWGGEALLGRPGTWQRLASWRAFRVSGGDRAAREPWRAALGLCWESEREWPPGEQRAGALLRRAFDAGVNTAVTTSVGRLFDAAAALLGICLESSYEGEAAMRLESLCDEVAAPLPLPLARDAAGVWRSDWEPLVALLLDTHRPVEERAAVFHASLAAALCAQAVAVREQTGVGRVGLSGGVFQNRILTEQAQRTLGAAGFEVLIPQRLPVNDAAISFGQLIEAGANPVHSAPHVR